MTDKTVSACCGSNVVNKHCHQCGGYCFPKTPTNPPTETVSDCCGAKLEVIRHSGDEGNGVYICGKCHIYCSPKTPTEPTVDKWKIERIDGLVDEVFEDQTPGFGLKGQVKNLCHSLVQEAKAERDKFWINRINITLDGVQDAYGEWYKDRLTKLSTLNTKEGK